jgi:predicted acetyltransferase
MLKYRFVSKQHWLCVGDAEDPGEPPDNLWGHSSAYSFWEKYLISPSDRGLLVTKDGAIVGFIRYNFDKGDVKKLHAAGTWVRPSFRRKKLAMKMWLRIIQKHQATHLRVTTVTKGGTKLMFALVKKTRIDMSHIEFRG